MQCYLSLHMLRLNKDKNTKRRKISCLNNLACVYIINANVFTLFTFLLFLFGKRLDHLFFETRPQKRSLNKCKERHDLISLTTRINFFFLLLQVYLDKSSYPAPLLTEYDRPGNTLVGRHRLKDSPCKPGSQAQTRHWRKESCSKEP